MRSQQLKWKSWLPMTFIARAGFPLLLLIACGCSRRNSQAPDPLSPDKSLQTFRLSEDFHVELTDVIDANDDQVVWATRQRGRGKGSGVEVVGEVAFVSTFHDGKTIRIEMFQSLDEALATVERPA